MMARALTDKSLGLFLPAFTSHSALWVQEESGTIQTIHKIPVAAHPGVVSLGGHCQLGVTEQVALPRHSHVVHIRPCSLFQHLIRHFEARGELGMLWKRKKEPSVAAGIFAGVAHPLVTVVWRGQRVSP